MMLPTPWTAVRDPVVIVIRQNKSQFAVVQMLSVVENAGVALAPKDARDRCFRKRADRKLHSNVLGDGSDQEAPCQGTLGF
eukprot:354024-Chlamydomonas_euryale.AAC.4